MRCETGVEGMEVGEELRVGIWTGVGTWARECKRKEAGRGRLSDLLCGQMLLQDWEAGKLGRWGLARARARLHGKGRGRERIRAGACPQTVFLQCPRAHVSAAEELARASANQGGLNLEQDGVDGKVTHTHQHSHATNTDLCRRRPHDTVGGGGKARRKLGLGLGARQRFRAVESSGRRE